MTAITGASFNPSSHRYDLSGCTFHFYIACASLAGLGFTQTLRIHLVKTDWLQYEGRKAAVRDQVRNNS